MTAQRRRWLLGLGGVLTLVLAWYAPQEDTAVSRPKTAAVGQRAASAPLALRGERPETLKVASDSMRQEQLGRVERSTDGAVADLFKSTSWYVPPPPPPPLPKAPPPPPPVPTAPALPFVFLGQIVEDQKVQVILARGDRVITVMVGDSIDKNHRLESFKGGILTFVYLPLDTRQTLATGLTP